MGEDYSLYQNEQHKNLFTYKKEDRRNGMNCILRVIFEISKTSRIDVVLLARYVKLYSE